MKFKQTLKKLLSYSSILFPYTSKMSINKANKILDDTYNDSNGTCIASNKLDIKYDIQIIVPAYNVEKYIKECLDSLERQVTKYKGIITIVDDGSSDNTGVIIDKIITTWGGATRNI